MCGPAHFFSVSSADTGQALRLGIYRLFGTFGRLGIPILMWVLLPLKWNRPLGAWFNAGGAPPAPQAFIDKRQFIERLSKKFPQPPGAPPLRKKKTRGACGRDWLETAGIGRRARSSVWGAGPRRQPARDLRIGGGLPSTNAAFFFFGTSGFSFAILPFNPAVQVCARTRHVHVSALGGRSHVWKTNPLNYAPHLRTTING